MIEHKLNVGDFVVPSINYPMSMCTRPSNDSISSKVLWQNEMSAVILDIHDTAGSVFVQLLTSTGTIAWVDESFVKLSK